MSNNQPSAGSLNIVHAVLALDIGGLERIVVDLTKLYCQRGHRVSILCVERPGQLAGAAEAEGAAVVSLDKPHGRNPEYIKRAATVLQSLQPDVVHSHTITALWYVGPGARQAGAPIVHTEHNNHIAKNTRLAGKLRARIKLNRGGRFASRFCGVSPEITASARRWGTVPSRKLLTVLNGIDTERYAVLSGRNAVRAQLAIPENARVVGTVGRLNEVKRQDLLLKAVVGLGDGFEDVHVLLVGGGPEQAALEGLAASLGLGERAHFAGFQSSPERFLTAMDVFALTSRLEGLPLALLEALASGLPVVASAVGGVPTLVRTGETGWLFPSGDVPALQNALRQALSNQAMAAATAAAGRRLVCESYSLERMATDYERLYHDVIAERNGTPLTCAHSK